MLDSDLSEIYGYETKNFNRQVKNNTEKFPEDMMFQVTSEEYETILRCKNFTSSWGGKRYLPYVFTEQGIYMLMEIRFSEDFHDRFMILDNKVLYHIGASLKDAGKKAFEISIIDDEGQLLEICRRIK